jgi:hypothetical protein
MICGIEAKQLYGFSQFFQKYIKFVFFNINQDQQNYSLRIEACKSNIYFKIIS